MRLTLRTLLAYMDDILDPADHEDLGRKIESSPFATELIHRSRDAVRRLRLSAPDPLAGADDDVHGGDPNLDANTAAEYLDNTLAPKGVEDFERSCLEAGASADMLLAEAASCHHVLTMVLGEPAEVDGDLRQRMYALAQSPAAAPQRVRIEPAHVAPQEAPAAVAVAAPAPAPAPRAPRVDADEASVPDFMRAAALEERRRARRLTAGFAAAVLLGGGATWLFWPSEEPKAPAELAELGDEQALLGAPTVDEAVGPTTSASADGETAAAPAGDPDSAAPPFQPATPVAPAGDAAAPALDAPLVATAPLDGAPPVTLPPEAPSAIEPAPVEPGEAPPADTDATAATPPVIEPPAGESTAVEPPAVEPPMIDAPASEAPVAAAASTAPALPAPPALAAEPADPAAPPTADPAAPATAEPPAAAPADPAAPPKPVGAYLGNNDLLLKFDPAAKSWVRLPPRTALVGGEQLLALPAFRTHVVLADVNAYLSGGAQIDLITPGNVDGAPPAELALHIPYGQVVLNSGLNGNRIELSLVDQTRVVELGPSSSLALEVRRVFVPGGGKRDPAPAEVAWFLSTGTAKWGDAGSAVAPAAWTTVGGVDSAPAAIDELPEWVDREPISANELRARERVAAALLPGENVDLHLLELSDPTSGGRRTEDRALAARGGAYVGLYDALVSALADVNQRAAWKTHVESLRQAIARDPASAEGIHAALALERGQEAADDLMEMLLGFDRAAVGTTREEVQQGALVRLLRWMEHDDLVYRVLAWYNANEILGTRDVGGYKPEQSADQRKRMVNRLWERLERGELMPPATKPTP